MPSVISRVTPGFAAAWYQSWDSLSTAKKMTVRIILAAMLVGFISLALSVDPAHAVSNGVANARGVATGAVDTAEVQGWSTNPWKYLVVGRWDPVQFSPSGFLGFGSVVSYGPYLIQVMFSSISALIARAFIGAIVLTSGGMLIELTSGKIDEVFAKVGNGVLGNGSGAVFSGQGAVVVGVLLIALCGLSAWRLAKGGMRAAGSTFLGGLLAVALLLVMSSAAATSTRTGNYTSADGAQRNASSAVFSPSWFIGMSGNVTSFIGDGLQSVMTAMSDSLDQNQGGSQDECERYVAAMHYTFSDVTGSTSADGIVTSFDAMVAKTLHDNIRIASMGGESDSADSSWCRFSDMSAGAPAADQVKLSRTAGLYSDIVGYTSSQAMPSAQGKSANDGSAVTSGGSYTDGGEELAANIFGPEFSRGEYADRAIYFWAACNWNDIGGDVSLNPEWSNVYRSYATDEDVWDAMQDAATSPWSALGPLGTGINFVVEFFTKEEGSKTTLGGSGDSCGYVVDNGLAESDGDDGGETGARSFQYGEKYSLIGTLTNWNVSSVPLFRDTLNDNDTEAYDFYRATQGLTPTSSFAGVMSATFSTSIFMWFGFPIIFGLLFSQIFGIVAWMLLPLALLGMIVPTQKTKMLVMMAVKTILYSMFSVILFQFVLQFALFVYSMLVEILVPDGNGWWMGDNSILRWYVQALAAVLGFIIVKKVVKAVFTNDITSIRGAVRQSTQIANRPLMSARGDLDPDYGMRRPGFLSRTASHATGSAIGEGRRKISDALGERFSRSTDSSTEPPMKDQESKGGVATKEKTTTKPTGGEPQSGKDWRKAAGAGVGAGAVGAAAAAMGSAGAGSGMGAQARGNYSVDPEKETFSIPKDGVVTVGSGSGASEADIMKNSLTADEYEKLSAKDKRAFTFDPVSGRFVSKLAASGISAGDFEKDINAPLSALMSKTAPEGISQEDWDKTALMRAQIATDSGMLDKNMTPERKSLFDAAAEGAREKAAAAGVIIPSAPDLDKMAAQSPGMVSTDHPGSINGATPTSSVVDRYANGQIKEESYANRGDHLVGATFREDGSIESKEYHKNGQNVSRSYDAEGNMVSESWRDANGNASPRADGGPTQTTYAADGSAARQVWEDGNGQLSRVDGPAVRAVHPDGRVSEEFHLGGQQMSRADFEAATAAAAAAVASNSALTDSIANSVSMHGTGSARDAFGAVDANSIAEASRAAAAGNSGIDSKVLDAAVAAHVGHSVSSMMQQARMDASGMNDFASSPRMSLEDASSVISQMSALPMEQQSAIAQQAARAVLDDTSRYAEMTNADPARVAAAAQSILDNGSQNPRAAMAMAELVNNSMDSTAGMTRNAEMMREMLVSAGREAGVPMAQTQAQTMADMNFGPPSAPAMNLDVAQQTVIAQEAARAVLDNIGAYSGASSMSQDSMRQVAEAVANGNGSTRDMEMMMNAVRQQSDDMYAERVRAMMESVAASNAALPSMSSQLDASMEEVSRISERMRDERVTAISDAMHRQVAQTRAEVEAQLKTVNDSLIRDLSAATPTGGMTEDDFGSHIADIQRRAAAERAAIEEQFAQRMGAALDSAGVELSNASVPGEYLDGLRDNRSAMLSNFEKVKGVRSWFQH